MPYKVYVINSDSSVESMIQPKAPAYEQIKRTVGGYIQQVPHLTKYLEHKRGQMFVNEEGIIHNLPFNKVATDVWLDNLGKGPFMYEPKLYGNAIYWCKIK